MNMEMDGEGGWRGLEWLFEHVYYTINEQCMKRH